VSHRRERSQHAVPRERAERDDDTELAERRDLSL
jgi:hypothetical protein